VTAPIGIPADIAVLAGPRRFGSELRWIVQVDGREAVLAQLAPELAAEVSIRERWIADTARMIATDVPAHCRPIRTGPDGAADDTSLAPPWRLRPQPEGVPLDVWLREHAPAPCDDVVAVLVAIARAVGEVHDAGAVVRDLAPRNIVLGTNGVQLVDIGLSRTDVLSSRTAASLMIEDSPFGAPELLRRTGVDRRADIYSIGVIAYVALTGVPPWGDRGAVLRPPGQPPGVRSLRPEVPFALERIIDACLAEDPAARPDGALALVELLSGRDPRGPEHGRVTCQACGASMRLGQRLCLQCGKQVVQFEPSHRDAPDRTAVVLTKAAEDAEYVARLRNVLAAIAHEPPAHLNILVGDERMYSKREREQMLRLPVRLFDGMSPTTSAALVEHLQRAGLQTKIVPHIRPPRMRVLWPALVGAMTAIICGVLIATGHFVQASIIVVIGVAIAAALTRLRRRSPPAVEALMRLRTAPAALPASDPWVARLGALLGADTPADVREQVGELALAVQRLVDHRLEHRAERVEIDMVTAPIDRLVELVEREVAGIAAIDRELSGPAGLDEGELVRRIARSEARGEPETAREPMRAGLQRLRALEDNRARAMHRLLDAAALVRRSVALGLGVRDPELEHARLVEASLAALTAGSSDDPH
jgi:hypothetical protein